MRNALRIVGFYEYTHALQKFDELVRIASPEELEVIDRIIAKREELAITTNLSVRFLHPPNVLDEVSDDPNDRFVRRGLAWLMALARVEVATTAAGFTPRKSPFAFVGATEFELPAYRELLLDGLRSHYWALSNDSDLPAVRKGRVEIHRLIVYGRRLFLMREMLDTMRLLAGDADPRQLKELKDWDKTLEQIQSEVIFSLTEKIRSSPATEFAHFPCPSLEEAVQMGLLSPRPSANIGNAASAPALPSATESSISKEANGNPADGIRRGK